MATPEGTHDLTGERFHRLVVRKYLGRTPKYRKSVWLAVCDCGEEVVVKAQELIRGDTKSCGCLAAESTATRNRASAKHAKHRSREHVSWIAAKGRCFNTKDKDYPRYGGRGVTMCAEWAENFSAFLSYMGPRPDGTTLERIDVNGNYEPGNCTWATPKQQANNRRTTRIYTFDGESLPATTWASRFGITVGAIHKRMKEKGTLDGYDPRGSRKTPCQEVAHRG